MSEYSDTHTYIHIRLNTHTYIHNTNISQFVYTFIRWWAFGLFYVLAIMNTTTINIHAQVSIWTYVFLSIRYVPRSSISESYANSVFNV